MKLLYYFFPFLSTLHNDTIIYNETMIMQNLVDYGYLQDMNANKTEIKASLREFQYFTDIEPTGELNKETVEMLEKTRCGWPDRLEDDTRKRRYVFAPNGPASKVDLTYRTKLYANSLSPKETDAIFAQALNLWSRHSGLKFKPTPNKSDIEISFKTIDGVGRVYGFAEKPTYKSIILDKDEVWTKQSEHGINLFQVATHEFGHALGLAHSDRRTSVMYPYYNGFEDKFSLDIDDINGIKALYRNFQPQKQTLNGNASILCNDSKIDAIFTAPDRYIYVFKNEYYWKLSYDFVMAEGPTLIKSRWSDLPNHIDTAFTAWNNVTYFFKGDVVWKYVLNEKQKLSKLIQFTFENIPDDLDAAFIWSGNGRLYFFKGTKYWKFDAFKRPKMRVKKIYPLPIKKWDGVPNSIDDAVSVNGVTYFFKDDLYYKYNDRYKRVEKGYPKSIKYEIFRCKL